MQAGPRFQLALTTAGRFTRVSGNSSRGTTGEMLAGAEVRLLNRSGLALDDRPFLQTDDDGSFRFEDVDAGHYMLEVAHTYTTEAGPLRYKVRSDRFKVSNQPPMLAVGLSRAGAMLERQINEGHDLNPYDVSMWVRRGMLSPQVKLDQPGSPTYVNVLSTEVAAEN